MGRQRAFFRRHEANVFAIGILAFGLASTFVLYQYFLATTQEAEKDRFAIVSEKRRAIISAEMERKKTVLSSLSRFFQASDSVSKQEFKVFSEFGLQEFGLDAICWISSDGATTYRVGSNSSMCSEFGLLEANKMISANGYWILLSRFTQTRTGQKGFASIVFPLTSLAVSSEDNYVLEHIIVHDKGNNLVDNFLITGNGVEHTSNDLDLQNKQRQLSELATLGDFELTHLITNPVNSNSVRLTTSQSIICYLVTLISLLISLFVRKVVQQKYDVERIVDERTKSLSESNQALSKAKSEADRANAHKSIFLANMSHEIRTPLNGIVGIIDLLKNDIKDPAQRSLFRTLSQSSETLLTVISDVLDISKLEAGKIELEDRDFNIRSTFDDLLQLYQATASEKGLSIDLSFSENAPVYVGGDEVRLKQVIGNLLSNAIKFTKSGGVHVRVNSETEDDLSKLSIAVEDTGIGISRDHQSTLFDAFSQVDASTTRLYGGTGLGLSISKNILDLMGGTIAVESEAGRGTVFLIEVAFRRVTKDEHLVAKPSEDSSLVPENLGRVLLVEDNTTNQIVARGMLEKFGLTPDLAEDGLVALEQLEKGPYDLVFMDCHMPNLDGIEATKRIRANPGLYGKPSIIALTASVMEDEVEKMRLAGMDDVLSKPLRKDELGKILAKFQANR